jgi:hypothetical protein
MDVRLHMMTINLLPHDPHPVVPLERYHDGHPKPECRAYKLLGIHLDEHLNFNYHTNFLCNKLSRSLFCIRRAKNILTPTARKTLYFAFIQSHLNYCPIILSSISQQNFNQIKLIQKKLLELSQTLPIQLILLLSLHS